MRKILFFHLHFVSLMWTSHVKVWEALKFLKIQWPLFRLKQINQLSQGTIHNHIKTGMKIDIWWTFIRILWGSDEWVCGKGNRHRDPYRCVWTYFRFPMSCKKYVTVIEHKLSDALWKDTPLFALWWCHIYLTSFMSVYSRNG